MNGHGIPAWTLRRIILVTLCFFGTVLADAEERGNPRGSQTTGLRWQRDDGSLALLKNDKQIWQFNWSPKLSKPYFHPVALPGGSDLTWLSPADHPHHLALFFCWKYLNRINYWEEPAGMPDGATKWSNVKVESLPDFSGNIAMDLQYHPQGATIDVLTEKRAIHISPPAPDGSYLMDWRLEFTAGKEEVVMDRTPPDTRPDGNARGGYAGLSIRFAKELSDARITASAEIGTLQNNRYGFAATAVEFSGEIDGAAAGVAFLDHAANSRSSTRWYGIMDKSVPFWFLNASLLQLEPYILPPHRALVLRYRVIIHPLRWDSARLAKEHARYVQEIGKD